MRMVRASGLPPRGHGSGAGTQRERCYSPFEVTLVLRGPRPTADDGALWRAAAAVLQRKVVCQRGLTRRACSRLQASGVAGEAGRSDSMKVVILCGGKGTRLREETEFRPKPMVEIGGRPILWHIMKLYEHYGLNEFVLCLGYKGSVIKEYFLNYDSMLKDFTVSLGDSHRPAVTYHDHEEESSFTVTLADTGAETMTGGRLFRAQRYVDGDTFMMTYGDGLSDVNIEDLLAFHQAHGKLATITAIQPSSRFGLLDLDANGQVARFREKPLLDDWINGGFFVFNRGVFDYLDAECVFEQAPLMNLARDGQLVAYRHMGFWQAMDTYRDTLYLNEMWNSGDAPWAVWHELMLKVLAER
jgi:glucose-1-phosphate cytidylyltransferase